MQPVVRTAANGTTSASFASSRIMGFSSRS
jgi:hypothetical protein